jgi:prepilin-type N-terminal cleavage/methylation domain-containing protein
MGAIIKNLRREDGFTLVELLVAMAAMLVVAGGAMSVLVSLQRNAANDVERAHAIREAEQGMLRMTKDLREAFALTDPNPNRNEITFQAKVRGVSYSIRYNCAVAHPTLAGVYQCVRTATSASITRTDVVVERVLNAAASTPLGERVFQYPYGRPSYVRIRIAVPARGRRTQGYAHRVVLDDGVYMRNCDVTC